MTATLKPLQSKPSGQDAVWTRDPSKSCIPGTSGHFHLLLRVSIHVTSSRHVNILQNSRGINQKISLVRENAAVAQVPDMYCPLGTGLLPVGSIDLMRRLDNRAHLLLIAQLTEVRLDLCRGSKEIGPLGVLAP